MIDDDWKPLGMGISNPITNTRIYEVDYLYGTVKTLADNIISENLLFQVDQEGHCQLLIDEIVDHRKTPEAVDQKDGFLLNPKWKPQATIDHQRVGVICTMEGCIIQLGHSHIPQELISR